jgi:multiple sugar transport system substrate-binding protein
VAGEVKQAWPAGVVSAASVGGALYGIPNEIDVYALNYNKELFKEAGIAAAPKTWAEFKDAAAKLTKKDAGQQGFGMINSWAAGVVHPFSSLLVSNGGELVKDGKPALDSEQAAETFQLYEDLIKSGASDPAMATADANTTGPFLDNFVSGKTGMIIMANWWESALKSGMGDKFANIATAPIPVGPHGDKPHSISYSWMTVVNANAGEAERKAAWDFLAWLNSPKSGQNGGSAMAGILMSMGILPSRTSDVEAYKDKLGSEFLAGYVSVLADAKPFRSCSADRNSASRCKRPSRRCSTASYPPRMRRRRRRPTPSLFWRKRRSSSGRSFKRSRKRYNWLDDRLKSFCSLAPP